MGRAGDSLVHEFPPRSGGWGAHRVNTVDGPKRGGPWIRWLLLLNLIISLTNNYCWTRWTTPGVSRRSAVYTFTTSIFKTNVKRVRSRLGCLLSWPLFRHSRLRITISSLQNIMYFHRFLQQCRFHTRISISFRRLNHVGIKMIAVFLKNVVFI